MSFFFNDNKNSENLDTLTVLMGLVSKNSLGRLEIKEGDLKIVIDGKPCPPPKHDIPPTIEPISIQPSVQSLESVPNNNIDTNSEKSNITSSNDNDKVVKAPIVGTFYASSSPNKPPYVKVGDTVKKGDVIMIIESMKLMNEVQSDFDGVVKEILVQDGSPVEYDQPIMIIE